MTIAFTANDPVRPEHLSVSRRTLRRALRGAGLAAVLCGLIPVAHAADLDAGRKLAEERCAACHGKDFDSPIDPSYPKLAGQHGDYLLAALREYKRETRKNAIMGAQAKLLSTADMENLSAYLESLPGSLYLPR